MKTIFSKDTRKVVTQLLLSADHADELGTEDRQLVFHCHMLVHISRISRTKLTATPGTHDLQHHIEEDMAGLIMGIHVLPSRAQEKSIE